MRKAKAGVKKEKAHLAKTADDQGLHSPFALRIAVEVKAGTFYMAGSKSLPAQVIVIVMEVKGVGLIWVAKL